MWRDIFELASRKPHYRILRAAQPSKWFDQASAAKANASTAQSVSRPLTDLQAGGLLELKPEGRRVLYSLTPSGEAVRHVLLRGPLLLPGVSLVAVKGETADPRAVREVLRRYAVDASVWRAAGDFDYVSVAGEQAPGDPMEELAYELRRLGTAPGRALITRHVT